MANEAASHEATPDPARLSYVLVLSFLTGAAVMAVELAAPRLVAPDLGSGLVTWSGTFAVFLAAMAFGNWIGGRLADRAGRRLGATLFVGAAALVLLVIPGRQLVASNVLAGALPHHTIKLRAKPSDTE